MSNRLTPLQQNVFDLLDAKPNTDVSIFALYEASLGEAPGTLDMHGVAPDNRSMQQKLGPLLHRINAKLKHGRIEPGVVKRTYRLTIKKKG